MHLSIDEEKRAKNNSKYTQCGVVLCRECKYVKRKSGNQSRSTIDMFKSALGYFSGAGSSASKEENEFVGQIVSLGIYKLRILKVIAEGGFGFVFLVQDTHSNKSFALKRMFSVDQESADSIGQEIRVLKQLNGHPNVIEFCTSAVAESTGGRKEYLILTELCPGGVVVDAVNKGKLSADQVLKIFYQCCKAVLHMHTQQPPITHRDLKLENLLIARDGTVKLCDFGSSTTACHHIDDKWTALKRSLVEDEVQRNTTPMYRGPECLDTYNNFPIDHRLDVWALGCILYVLCYRQHPFADAAKLAILNAKYNRPTNSDPELSDLQPLIGDMLTIDPRERPSVDSVLHKLEIIGQRRGLDLSSPPFPAQQQGIPPISVIAEPVVEAPAARAFCAAPEGANLMNSLRGGAGSFFKKLGDTSSKVIQIAQQSIGRSELDMHYITNRIAVMSYPAEGLESTYRNHIEDVRAVLEARHQSSYMVVNISGRSYTNNKFPGVKVIERSWNQKKTPTVDALLEICHSIYAYLSGKRNAVVIHCLDGKAMSAQFCAAFMLYCRIFTNPKDALSMFAVKRFPVSLSPAQMRYLEYFYDVFRRKAPHGQIMEITRVSMRPPPLFTKVRDGCRPFINVYVKDECVYSTCLEYEKLVHYPATAGNVDFVIPNTRVFGDVTITLNHARASTFAKGRIQAIPMAQIQLFTGYIETSANRLVFDINQLDLIDEVDRYPEEFELVLHIRFVDEAVQDPMAAFSKYLNITTQPRTPFNSEEEMNAAIDLLNLGGVGAVAGGSSGTSDSSQALYAQSSTIDQSNQNNDDNIDLLTPVGGMTMGSGSGNSLGGAGEYCKKRNNLMDSRVLVCEDVGSTPTQQQQQINDDLDPFGIGTSTGFTTAPLNGATPSSNQQVIEDLFASTAEPSHTVMGASSSSSGELFGQWDSFMNTPVPTVALGNLETPNVLGTARTRSASKLPEDIANETESTPPASNGVQMKPSALFTSIGGSCSGSSSSTGISKGLAGLNSPIGSAFPGSESNHWNMGAVSLSQQQPNIGYAALPKAQSPIGNGAGLMGEGARKPVSENTFDDLLGTQGFANFGKKDTGPRTMAEMKRIEMTRKMDPVRLVIYDWTKGKERNIRALLCSLHSVVWPEARWIEIGMHQLVGVSDVKKMYRKACLAVHPDKLAGTDKEELAKLIFMELNDAWSEFEKQQGLA
ncbi:cyclin-G-associated kinase-like [Tropilaelaps mercedesae]|uniref:Cyclin-G-associated kinase-like n=1 Tax=Tropilaelaps mercedesae TaxID=418985 RepID=A0A1V9XAE7_9ACAR|nr:cyclin-G-associated kinase-like [Tropilaelaps mercedesae]